MSPSLYIPLLLSLCLAGCSLSTSGSLSEVTPTDSGSKTTGGDGPSTTDEPPDSGNAAEDAAQDAGPVADSAAPPDSAPEDAGPPGCALSGKQALHIDASVRWDAKTLLGIVPVLEAGTGTLSVTVLVDHQRDGNVLEGKLRVCDARMPAFTSSLLGETYATRFDHAVWDAPDMPDVPVRMELECPDPGCSLGVPSVTVLLGVELPDPTTMVTDNPG